MSNQPKTFTADNRIWKEVVLKALRRGSFDGETRNFRRDCAVWHKWFEEQYELQEQIEAFSNGCH